MSEKIESVDLINFKKVSEFLTGKSFNLRADRSFGKHKEDVSELKDFVSSWMEKIEKRQVSSVVIGKDKKSAVIRNSGNEVTAIVLPPNAKFVSGDKDVSQDTVKVETGVNPPDWAKNKVVVHKIQSEKTEFTKSLDEIYDLEFVDKLPDLDDQVYTDKKQIAMFDKYNPDVFFVKWEDKFLKFIKKAEFLRFCKDNSIK